MPRTHTAHSRIWLFFFSLILFTACGEQSATNRENSATSEDDGPSAVLPLESDDEWFVTFVEGQPQKNSYTRSTFQEAQQDGRHVVIAQQEVHMTVNRFGDRSEPNIKVLSVQTPGGRLLRFEARLGVSGSATSKRGVVEDGFLKIEETAEGSTSIQRIAWKQDYRGPFGVELSLRHQPLEPGEERSFHGFDPAFGLMNIELKAGELESTPILEGSAELLRIQAVMTSPQGQRIAQTLWVDPQGQVQKSRFGVLVSYRTTREVALKPVEGQLPDVGLLTTIPVDREIADPHRSRSAVYRIHLKEGDPAELFTRGATQQVRSSGPGAAEIIVEAIRPAGGGPAPPRPAGSPPTAADTASSTLIQSDDPQIVQMAGSVAPGESDPWKTAVALEHLVHEVIQEKNFETAFASAAEVARTKAGDCSEHAVLLAALCRARGIPARVAVGLVYSPRQSGFAFHMWNEVHIGGDWIPIDATLGQGGIGAAHIKLAQDALAGPDAFKVLLPVAQVMGQLKIEVLTIE